MPMPADLSVGVANEWAVRLDAKTKGRIAVLRRRYAAGDDGVLGDNALTRREVLALRAEYIRRVRGTRDVAWALDQKAAFEAHKAEVVSGVGPALAEMGDCELFLAVCSERGGRPWLGVSVLMPSETMVLEAALASRQYAFTIKIAERWVLPRDEVLKIAIRYGSECLGALQSAWRISDEDLFNAFESPHGHLPCLGPRVAEVLEYAASGSATESRVRFNLKVFRRVAVEGDIATLDWFWSRGRLRYVAAPQPALEISGLTACTGDEDLMIRHDLQGQLTLHTRTLEWMETKGIPTERFRTNTIAHFHSFPELQRRADLGILLRMYPNEVRPQLVELLRTIMSRGGIWAPRGIDLLRWCLRRCESGLTREQVAVFLRAELAFVTGASWPYGQLLRRWRRGWIARAIREYEPW